MHLRAVKYFGKKAPSKMFRRARNIYCFTVALKVPKFQRLECFRFLEVFFHSIIVAENSFPRSYDCLK